MILETSTIHNRVQGGWMPLLWNCGFHTQSFHMRKTQIQRNLYIVVETQEFKIAPTNKNNHRLPRGLSRLYSHTSSSLLGLSKK